MSSCLPFHCLVYFEDCCFLFLLCLNLIEFYIQENTTFPCDFFVCSVQDNFEGSISLRTFTVLLRFGKHWFVQGNQVCFLLDFTNLLDALVYMGRLFYAFYLTVASFSCNMSPNKCLERPPRKLCR